MPDYEPHVIYRCVVGSRAYGLEGEDSDTDRRGIFLPPASLHWSLAGMPDCVTDPETQDCYSELKPFLVLATTAKATRPIRTRSTHPSGCS
jgi:predicted nucleotidyltransferase